jgi:electron transfer flavoprotein beta subunit
VRVAACVKWVDLRPEVDPLTGAVRSDERFRGASNADRAALEVALRLGDTWSAPVDLVVAGPSGADAMLRELGASGADRLVRVDLDPDVDSATVGRALVAATADATVVVCGDQSLDRGSGAVPSFLARALGVWALCGLVGVEPQAPGAVEVIRRLGRGRSERLRAAGGAVLSVEGSVAALRRAGLADTLATADRPVEVIEASVTTDVRIAAGPMRPWRPPARVIAAPAGDAARDRIVALTGALTERTPPRTVEAGAVEAADLIVEQLGAWGYLEEP